MVIGIQIAIPNDPHRLLFKRLILERNLHSAHSGFCFEFRWPFRVSSRSGSGCIYSWTNLFNKSLFVPVWGARRYSGRWNFSKVFPLLNGLGQITAATPFANICLCHFEGCKMLRWKISKVSQLLELTFTKNCSSDFSEFLYHHRKKERSKHSPVPLWSVQGAPAHTPWQNMRANSAQLCACCVCCSMLQRASDSISALTKYACKFCLAVCVLPCVTVCYSMLQCVTMCCRALPCVAVCCRALPCVAVRCRALPCVALCLSVLQCVAVWTWAHNILALLCVN